MSTIAEPHIRLPEGSIEKTTTTLNLGPTHPATHGVFQNILNWMEKGLFRRNKPSDIFIVHLKKLPNEGHFTKLLLSPTGLNYCSSPINNMGWHMTCEKLLGVKTPKRVDYLRVIIMELARICDHLICNSIVGVDTGAYTGFLYLMQYRELIYEI